jgi:signal transduction histidine kinase/DNA-binding response OmpR family regulator
MNKVKHITCLIFLCFTQIIYAQHIIPDSLTTNSEKAMYFNTIAKKQSQLDSSLFYTQKALDFAIKSDNDSILVATYYHQANYAYIKGNDEKSIALFQKSLEVSILKNNAYYIFRNHSKIGKAYLMNGKENLGLDHIKKALEVTIQMQDSLLIGDAYNNIGDSYKTLDLDSQAKKYFLLALEVYNASHVDESEKMITYKNLSRLANTIDETNYYLDKAQQIVLKENNPRKTSLFYLTKADALFRKSFYKNAAISADKSYKISDSINFNIVKNLSLIILGKSHYQLNNYTKSEQYLEKALSLKQDNNQNYFNALETLSKTLSAQKKYKKAYLTSIKMRALMDSISVYKTTEKFAEFDVKFKTAQKDNEIAKQQLEIVKQKNNKNKLIIGSLVLLLIGYVIFQWLFNKQKQKKILTENELQNEQEINDLRTKFLGNIAHEIRTPLTLISGNLNLALENIDNKPRAIQNINVALINSKKVVEDANEILELLKYEKSKITIKLNQVNLDSILKRIFYSFKSIADFKHIELDYQSKIPSNLQTQIDVEKLEKILNNLISNAIKYSPSNSKVIFNAMIKNDNLVVKVTDFGLGIHFDETDKIFQRFYQASNSQSVGGIGIGLSLAKEFAELLNGTLIVESKLNSGSTFTFTLPMSKIISNHLLTEDENTKSNQINKPQKEPFKTNLKPQKTDISKPKILIVEDNPEMNHYLVEILSKNYDCSVAFDGLEALEKVKTSKFDLITSDIMMPNLDGFQFREQLNENSKFKNIPFILISAKTLAEDKIKGFKLGIDDYIIKPFNKNELIARIDNLLTNKTSRDTWTSENLNLVSDTESSDTKLLKKIENVVLDNISDETFKIKDLATQVGYSQRQLTRILKQYTGLSPVKFILEIRLQKAYQNLQNKTFFSLSEVRYDVGITSSTYFNKKFKERFGITASELLK